MKPASSPPPSPTWLELDDGEVVIKRETVDLITGLLTVYAQMVLTNQRLLVRSISMPQADAYAWGVNIVSVPQILGVRRGSFWSRLRPGRFPGFPEAVITLKDAPPIRFRSRSATAWIRAIEALLK